MEPFRETIVDCRSSLPWNSLPTLPEPQNVSLSRKPSTTRRPRVDTLTEARKRSARWRKEPRTPSQFLLSGEFRGEEPGPGTSSAPRDFSPLPDDLGVLDLHMERFQKTGQVRSSRETPPDPSSRPHAALLAPSRIPEDRHRDKAFPTCGTRNDSLPWDDPLSRKRFPQPFRLT